MDKAKIACIHAVQTFEMHKKYAFVEKLVRYL